MKFFKYILVVCLLNSSIASAASAPAQLTGPQSFKLITSSQNAETLLKKSEKYLSPETVATLRKEYKSHLQTKYTATAVNDKTLQMSFDGTSIFFEVVDIKTHTYKINGKLFQSDRKLTVAETITKLQSYLPDRSAHFRYEDLLVSRADAFWPLLIGAALTLFLGVSIFDAWRTCTSAEAEIQECKRQPPGSAAFERLAPSLAKLGRHRSIFTKILTPGGTVATNYFCETEVDEFEQCMQQRAARLSGADMSQLSPDVRKLAEEYRAQTAPQPVYTGQEGVR